MMSDQRSMIGPSLAPLFINRPMRITRNTNKQANIIPELTKTIDSYQRGLNEMQSTYEDIDEEKRYVYTVDDDF